MKETDKKEPEVIFSFGGEFDESSVSLRIFGDDLDPEKVSEMLNCKPTKAYKKGHIITTTIRPRTIKTGQWFLSTEKNSYQTIEEQIFELFEKLSKDKKVWKNLHKQFEVNIFCGA